MAMATLPTPSSRFLSPTSPYNKNIIIKTAPTYLLPNLSKPRTLRVAAAKLPAGVEMPKVEPKLSEPLLGFTNTAEVWNSRACMIGLIGTFIVELIFHRGILQMIGVDVGKGLDLPL